MKDGILIINKEKDMTSHDVVAKARKALNTKKIGHTGTLDPMATGVLVLCVGAATKLVDYLTCDEKIYDVEMQLGIRTDTGDITGNIIEEKCVPDMVEYKEIFKSFIGNQKQIPPMYSAIKKDGVKLYELARKGIEIEREARDIEIFDIYNISDINDNKIRFSVHCSKGTYIRVLCEDIAVKLGTAATMTALNRTKTGRFTIDEANGINEISENDIIPLEKVLENGFTINENLLGKLINGMTIKCELEDGLYNLYCNNKYLGIGEAINKDLKRKIIVENEI
ncbi:MAG: tRNA pseudouridine(55) synthase TruB [Clostridia bacterium]|nr:tRNA pseudouridine(55) synthase TruB [Clostridia bacterium]